MEASPSHVSADAEMQSQPASGVDGGGSDELPVAVLHVEARLRSDSAASFADVEAAVTRALRARMAVPLQSGPLSPPSDPWLASQLEGWAVVDSPKTCDNVTVLGCHAPPLRVSVYQLNEGAPEEEEAGGGGCNGEEGGAPSYRSWALPHRAFAGAWEALAFDEGDEGDDSGANGFFGGEGSCEENGGSARGCGGGAAAPPAAASEAPQRGGSGSGWGGGGDIKTRLLRYASAALAFGCLGVDPNLVSCNRVALLHGPPGTGAWVRTLLE